MRIEKSTEATVSVGLALSEGAGRIVAIGDAQIVIGSQCILGNLNIYACAGSRVQIGRNVGFNGLVRLLLHEPCSISIGDDSLFGGDVDITVSDMHSILDARGGKRINFGRDVFIDDRVWVGQRCLIMKGSRIGKDSVIGAGSIVTGQIPDHCIAAGSPARVIRKGIRWKRELLPS